LSEKVIEDQSSLAPYITPVK